MRIEIEGEFPIVVDYSKSLAEMIKAGDYNEVCGGIRYSIRKKGKQEINIELVKRGSAGRIYLDDVIHDFKSHGLRPVTIPELLAFGATYPKEQNRFPIAALGSVWRLLRIGPRQVAVLGMTVVDNDYGRRLGIQFYDGVWNGSCRFAAVREVRPFQNDGDII